MLEQGTFLPVTRAAAEQALADIASNPTQRVFEEGAILQQFQPQINYIIGLRVTNHSRDKMYIEGSFWAHKVLRTQGELNRYKLPVVSEEVRVNYSRSRVEEIRTRFRGESMDQALSRLSAIMIADEPELARALKEIVKYRPNTDDFYSGAAETYLLLKAAQESIELERRFNQ